MKCYVRTYRILVIFLLLLWLVMPAVMYAQVKELSTSKYMPVIKTYHFDKQKINQLSIADVQVEDESNNVSEKNRYVLDNKQDHVEVPEHFEKSTAFNELELQENENYLSLHINGDYNSVTATQENGTGNIMDLGIAGSHNTGDYYQHGELNYIYDRIEGDNKYHQIHQDGDNLGIYNQGMQNLPLIITQTGQNMKLKITGDPGQ